MEERKSSNQVIENVERDFHFSDGIAENANHTKGKHYGRDLLLQLRLHPLSLQKPKDLPGMEVIKEKLYLHDINETCSTSPDRYLDNSHASMKPEYCNMKHEYPLFPHYLNRVYPYCFIPHGYNGSYQSTPSKFRPSFHTYCNPLKKNCVTSHQCYKDFPAEECLWTKRCFPSTEEIWNCYPSLIKKKEHLDAIPKSKKKLPIIDPVTGKNVLETDTSIHQEEQIDTYPVQGNSESYESCYSANSGEKYTEDCFCSSEVNDGPLEINETYPVSVCTSEDRTYYDKLKNASASYEDNLSYKKFEDNPNSHETMYGDKSNLIPSNKKEENSGVTTKDGTTTSTADSTVLQGSIRDSVKISENIDENFDTAKIANKKVHKNCQNRENSHADRHGNCQTPHRKDMHACKENIYKQNDSMKESFKPKDKLALRQEQQKMAILQSFLRYKKYQLEESARSLDEKRIEIANWECNLYNKAKRLHEKEVWLDSQNEILFNKAQQIADREKMLSKGETSSGDCPSSKSMFKETQFPEKKFALYNCSDAAWDEIPTKIKSNCKNDETNDYSYFGGCASNPNKVREDVTSNIEKCKLDTNSLDELEKNIIFIEKMHSSSEIGDSSLESKAEPSSNVPQKKDEMDPLGYSKGRRYLPEHIKYWLNKRDKSSL